MSFRKWMERSTRGLDWIDLGCIKAGAMLFALLAAKLWPGLLGLDPWVYAGGLLLVSIRPVAHALKSREEAH